MHSYIPSAPSATKKERSRQLATLNTIKKALYIKALYIKEEAEKALEALIEKTIWMAHAPGQLAIT
jgi:hypothetical protein